MKYVIKNEAKSVPLKELRIGQHFCFISEPEVYQVVCRNGHLRTENVGSDKTVFVYDFLNCSVKGFEQSVLVFELEPTTDIIEFKVA